MPKKCQIIACVIKQIISIILLKYISKTRLLVHRYSIKISFLRLQINFSKEYKDILHKHFFTEIRIQSSNFPHCGIGGAALAYTPILTVFL